MYRFEEREDGSIVLQALLGWATIVIAYLLGIVASSCLLGDHDRYLTPLGELITGAIEFCAAVGLWLYTRFRVSAMFLTALFTLLFVLVVLYFFGGGSQLVANRFAEAHWGMVEDLMLALRHTVLPVFCAALLLGVLRKRR